MVWIKTELDHLVSARYPEADGELVEWSNNGTANVTQEVADALVENRSYIDYLSDNHGDSGGAEHEAEAEAEAEDEVADGSDSASASSRKGKPGAKIEADAAAVVAESESESESKNDAADDA